MSAARILNLSFIFVFLLAGDAHAQDAEPLRVATKLFPPLVMQQGDQMTGFSIQLWDAIAQEMGQTYEFYEVETVTDQLDAVQNGEADAAIAGITITAEREALLDFSFPYFDAGLQIMIRDDQVSPIDNALNAVLAPEFLQFLGLFVVLILLASHVLWFIERRIHPEISPTYLKGIGRMLWWSAVTVIGYDDVPPRTFAGRVMALIWMFSGIFLIANLTASLSAGATVRELQSAISGVADLRTHRVATVEGTTSADFLRNAGVGYVGVSQVEDAYTLLRTRRVDAVVYDAPVLRYFARTEGRDDFRTVGSMFGVEEYGIALPEGSPLREPINRAILQLLENGTYQDIYNRWFGAESS